MLPHGSYSLIPAVLTSMGWLASLFQDGCDYSRLTGQTVSEIASSTDVPWLEVGFGAYREPTLNTKNGQWEVVYTGICFAYPPTVPQDAYWTASKAFDFLALVLGGGGTFFLWFSSCCVFSPATWRWAGYEVMFAAIFQTLSFLWFNTDMCQSSENHCALFWGSKADIVSAVLWTVAAMSIFCHYPAPKTDRRGDGLWLESGAATDPTVQVTDATLDGTTTGPTVTTEAAAAMGQVSGGDDQTAGQSSGQHGGEQPKVKPDLREVELT